MIEKIGKFEITRLLGRGSMGEVYLGRDPVLGREVAVKTISASSSMAGEARERFAREAQATAALSHPNIVTVFDFGEDQEQFYLVMEYVSGKDLQTLLEEKSLSRAECMEILAQISEALGFAHERGVIHRDVKPSNILVSRRGKRLQAKLTDFGVALINNSNLTQQGVWMGTVNYMAPEYLDTGKATDTSDLFAVGVILYEALTGGKKPFIGDSTTAVLNAILRSSMRPLEPEEKAGLPPAALDLLKKTLERSPENRYRNGDQLAEALRDIIDTFDKTPAPAKQEPASAPASIPAGVDPINATQAIDAAATVRPPTKPKLEKPLIVGKGPRSTCLSLRVALRQAIPGSQITLLPGVYKEPLVLDKDVMLQGEGDPDEIVIAGPISSNAKCEISGLTIKHNGEDSHAALLVQGGHFTLQCCKLETQTATGILVQKNALLVMRHSHLEGKGAKVLELAEGGQVQADNCQWVGSAPCLAETHFSSILQLIRCTINNQEGIGIKVRPNGQLRAEATVFEQAPAGCIELCPEARLQMINCRLMNSHYAGVLALEKSDSFFDECELSGHLGSAIHALAANVQLKNCKITGNPGYGITAMEKSQVNLDACEISKNRHAGIRIHQEGSVQLKNCRISDGLSVGIVCFQQGRGVLESCEISGNAQTGARVEPGGSLLLVKCALKDGQDTGLLLFEDAEATLEECVIHRNARGGILLAKDAMDPQLRGENQIQDQLVRLTDQGPVKVAPVKKH